MRRPTKALAIASAGALALSLTGLPTPASAGGQMTVSPGQSIQAAINAAGPDTTITVKPGTYSEQLLITKDNIRLHGNGVTLEPGGTTPANSICADPENPEEQTAICVAGRFGADRSLQGRVANVSVRGFTINDFAYGVFGLGVDNITVDSVTTNDNEEYGIFVNTSVNSRITNNKANGSEDAGIYVGDSPDANMTVANNEVWDNQFGLFIRDSRSGVIRNNFAHENCVGVLLLDTGAPSPSGDLKVHGNLVLDNTRTCAGGGPAPATSGGGIVVLGSDRNHFQSNSVSGNEPAVANDWAGGIVIGSSAQFGGSAAEGNQIAQNVISGNEPGDIVYITNADRLATTARDNLRGDTIILR